VTRNLSSVRLALSMSEYEPALVVPAHTVRRGAYPALPLRCARTPRCVDLRVSCRTQFVRAGSVLVERDAVHDEAVHACDGDQAEEEVRPVRVLEPTPEAPPHPHGECVSECARERTIITTAIICVRGVRTPICPARACGRWWARS
jgi:hypothetical protein